MMFAVRTRGWSYKAGEGDGWEAGIGLAVGM